MATKKKTVRKISGADAKRLVESYFAKKREEARAMDEIPSELEKAYPSPIERIGAATGILRVGGISLEDYLAAVDRWSKDKTTVSPRGVQEDNVVNWAVALTRATNREKKAHAMKMLALAVGRLGTP